MQKTYIGLAILSIALVVLVVVSGMLPSDGKLTLSAADEKSAAYVIDGQRVQLVKGKHEAEAAPGSASTIVTQYFGNAVDVDLNSDGITDRVFLMTQDMGGSGTFYYVVAALKTDAGYLGSEAFLLGDRIAPQATTLDARGNVIVAYADRNSGEDYSVVPHVGKSVVLTFDPVVMQFKEVPSALDVVTSQRDAVLEGKEWQWVSAQFEDGRTITPVKANAFRLSFTKEGTFSASTDCNGAGGEYVAKDGVIAFEKMMSTLMFCEGSQESEFTQLLTNAAGYEVTEKGELVLHLKFDSGTVLFR